MIDKIAKARQDLQFGAVEPALVQAVRATPRYADDVLDNVADGLAVMPELSAELLRIFAGRTSPHDKLSHARLQFLRGQSGGTCAWPESRDASEWQVCLLGRLPGNSDWKMPQPLPKLEIDKLVPELQRELALYWQVQIDPAKIEPDPLRIYLQGISALKFGDVEAAQTLLEKSLANVAFEPDSAFFTGSILDSAGHSDMALEYFERTLNAAGCHPAAAAEFIRLYDRMRTSQPPEER